MALSRNGNPSLIPPLLILFQGPGRRETGVASSIHYSAGLGPFELSDRTTVRLGEPPRHLELEAYGWPYGSVRISIEVLPWGGQAVVVPDEHPLRGLTLRNRRMLRRLARVVERRVATPS